MSQFNQFKEPKKDGSKIITPSQTSNCPPCESTPGCGCNIGFVPNPIEEPIVLEFLSTPTCPAGIQLALVFCSDCNPDKTGSQMFYGPREVVGPPCTSPSNVLNFILDAGDGFTTIAQTTCDSTLNEICVIAKPLQLSLGGRFTPFKNVSLTMNITNINSNPIMTFCIVSSSGSTIINTTEPIPVPRSIFTITSCS